MPPRVAATQLQLRRQWALLRLLVDTEEGLTVRELAEQLQASKPTIQRDLVALGQTFAVVEVTAGKQRRTYRIDETVRALESVTFSLAELLSLHAAVDALGGMSSTPLHGDLASVAQKLRGFLAGKRQVESLAAVWLRHPRAVVDYERHGEVIDDLGVAIAQRRRCEVRYRSTAGKLRVHKLRCLRLLQHEGALYLLAVVDRAKRITTFAVHRIEALTLSRACFEPTGFDVESHMRRAWGILVGGQTEEVEIVFSASVAWRIEERTWHPDEIKERLPDGRLRYTLRSGAEGELIPWVLGFGVHAELVAPASWRASIRASVAGMTTLYG